MRFQVMLFKLSWVLASGWSVRLMDAFFSPRPSHRFFFPRLCCSIHHLQCLSPSDTNHNPESASLVCSSESVYCQRSHRLRTSVKQPSASTDGKTKHGGGSSPYTSGRCPGNHKTGIWRKFVEMSGDTTKSRQFRALATVVSPLALFVELIRIAALLAPITLRIRWSRQSVDDQTATARNLHHIPR